MHASLVRERRIRLVWSARGGRRACNSEHERAALALTDAMTRLSQAQDVHDEVYGQAVSVFTADQYRAVVWAVTVMNAFNRLGVASRWRLPAGPG
jgi:alkylhydroperoxidase family enzyme